MSSPQMNDMVREEGLEPSRRKALVPKTNVSANFTTRAYGAVYRT